MAVLGVLFIVLALVLAGAGFWVASSTGAASSTVTLFNNSLTLNPLTMMTMGAIAMLLLLLGLWLMTSAGKRRLRNHQERRSLEKTQEQQERELAETRARLAARDGRAASGQSVPGVAPDGAHQAGTTPSTGLPHEAPAPRRSDPDVRP